jgi:hypothetical protein
MTDKERTKLTVKAIRSYAQEHYGWSAKYHPEDLEKYNTLMDEANKLEKENNGQSTKV